jgi:D-alanine--poly(phosphoribitol) ligase subunit 1
MLNALLDAVEKTAGATPDAAAYCVAGEDVTTYGELWAGACAIATELHARVEGSQPVMVLGPKGALTVKALLACLMSGHAYVPVDVELPAQRVADIAGQIAHATLLAACDVPEALAAALPSANVLDARELLAEGTGAAPLPREGWVAGEDTQYIIFTSGSTGRPKGIEVTATNVINFQGWMAGFPYLSDGGRVFLDQAHYSFDLSVYELVGALTTGGCLHAVSTALCSDFKALFADLATSGIEVWVSTPSFADLCLADPSFCAQMLPDVRLFLFCGEALHHTTVEKLAARFPGVKVANTYGPTESTVAITYCEIGEAELASPDALPVGYPRRGTELRIVDHETGEELPCGQTGEIVIVGDTVARGYYQNAEKTAEAFFETQMSDGRPMRAYRTGDLGFADADGMLHCAGRLDSLVKLNGYRIELSEIEGALEALGCVHQAAVVPATRGGRISSLAAFVVLDRATAAGLLAEGVEATDFALGRALKAELARTLPAYMVPRAIKVLDDMPLNANGKTDRKALAASVSR